MSEPLWEAVVRRCDNRLVVTNESGQVVFNQYHDYDPELGFRVPLNDRLKAYPHVNVFAFTGFNGISDPPDIRNPWRFEVDILKDGEVQKTMRVRGSSQRNSEEVKVWEERVAIRLPESKN